MRCQAPSCAPGAQPGTCYRSQPQLNLSSRRAARSYIREATLRLSGKVEDLEDVMGLMAALEEVRTGLPAYACTCTCRISLGLVPFSLAEGRLRRDVCRM